MMYNPLDSPHVYGTTPSDQLPHARGTPKRTHYSFSLASSRCSPRRLRNSLPPPSLPLSLSLSLVPPVPPSSRFPVPPFFSCFNFLYFLFVTHGLREHTPSLRYPPPLLPALSPPLAHVDCCILRKCWEKRDSVGGCNRCMYGRSDVFSCNSQRFG